MRQLMKNSGDCTAHFEECLRLDRLSSDYLDPAAIKALAKLDCSLEAVVRNLDIFECHCQ
jgi:hypothetical protein